MAIYTLRDSRIWGHSACHSNCSAYCRLLLVIYGLNTSSGMVIYQTQLQRRIPDAMRGRVFTWLDVVWNVMKIISLGIGGWLAEQTRVEVVYYLGGSLLTISGFLGIVLLRHEPEQRGERTEE